MENHLVAVKHNNHKSLVEIYHDDQKMTVHFLELPAKRAKAHCYSELSISPSGNIVEQDPVKEFFTMMQEQKNDLINYFG
jgi:hypothetical protein